MSFQMYTHATQHTAKLSFRRMKIQCVVTVEQEKREKHNYQYRLKENMKDFGKLH